MADLILRFFIGGIVVSVFAMLGDVFRPKSFAGLFGAAPSVALATIGLTIAHDGKTYASIEARSMMLGSIAFLLYAALVCRILMRYRPSTLTTAIALLPIWFAASFGLWFLMVRLTV